MRRREFVFFSGAAATWPLAAGAQQRQVPVVALLAVGSAQPEPRSATALRQSLAASGFVDGRNVAIETHGANYDPQRLSALAAELVQRQVAVIVAFSGPSIRVAQRATSTIPIVFSLAGDPIKWELVQSLNRPGGNATGMSLLSGELMGKRLNLLRDLVSGVKTVAYLSDPRVLFANELTGDVLAAGRALGQQVTVFRARTESGIDAAFTTIAERGIGALLVPQYLFFQRHDQKIIDLAARHRLPAIYSVAAYVRRGGLMSYVADPTPIGGNLASLYIAPILRGAKPSDLPVQQPSKFLLAINIKTAKALGLEIPPILLAIADEVIE
jgi:putative ABC transport system substrate-binding protein